MSPISDAELWMRVAAQIQSARGWSLRPLERLGRPRDTRRTWLAEAVARLALSAQRGEETQLEIWRRVTDAILESVCC
jgi:hypothetical protein